MPRTTHLPSASFDLREVPFRGTSTNVNGAATAFEKKVKDLEAALLAKGLIAEGAEGYAAVPGSHDAKTAGAMFTYFLIDEDGSMSVHNPNYFKPLVDAALEALK